MSLDQSAGNRGRSAKIMDIAIFGQEVEFSDPIVTHGEGIDTVLTQSDLASESMIVLRCGKRKYAVLKMT